MMCVPVLPDAFSGARSFLCVYLWRAPGCVWVAHTAKAAMRPQAGRMRAERRGRGAPGVRGGVDPGACPGVCSGPRAGGCRVPPPGGAAGGGLPGAPARVSPQISARCPAGCPRPRRAVRQVRRWARAESGLLSPLPPRGGFGDAGDSGRPSLRGASRSPPVRRPREPGRERGGRGPSLAAKGPRAACGPSRKTGGHPATTRVPRAAARGGTRAPPPEWARAERVRNCLQVWTLRVRIGRQW